MLCQPISVSSRSSTERLNCTCRPQAGGFCMGHAILYIVHCVYCLVLASHFCSRRILGSSHSSQEFAALLSPSHGHGQPASLNYYTGVYIVAGGQTTQASRAWAVRQRKQLWARHHREEIENSIPSVAQLPLLRAQYHNPPLLQPITETGTVLRLQRESYH